MSAFDLEAAQQAARALIGVGPDSRDYWGEYLTVDARALARLMDALQVPYVVVRSAEGLEVSDKGIGGGVT